MPFTKWGLFLGILGDCFTWGLQMGLKRPGRVLFSAVWPFFVPILKYSALKFFQIDIIWYICSIIETNMAKVIHVHLLHKIDGTKQKDWYFSSISAVYTVLTADQVGATKNYLLHAGLSGNGTICTKKAIIKQSTLISGGSKGNG